MRDWKRRRPRPARTTTRGAAGSTRAATASRRCVRIADLLCSTPRLPFSDAFSARLDGAKAGERDAAWPSDLTITAHWSGQKDQWFRRTRQQAKNALARRHSHTARRHKREGHATTFLVVCMIGWCQYAGMLEKDPLGGGAYRRWRVATQALIPLRTRHTIRAYTAFGSAEMRTRIVYVDSYDRCTCTRGNMRIKDAFRRVRVTACMQPGVASLVAVAFAFASRAWHWHGTAASTTVH